MTLSPTGNAPSAAVWDRRSYLLLLLLLVWRLLYITIAPFDLAPDEVYYWDWGRFPAWGYYSKPPLIAWINMLSSKLLPVSEFSVRMPAAVLSIVGLLALYGLARRLFSSRTAFWAVAASAASPGSCAAGLIMTIDAPLIAFWSLSLYGLWRALEQDGHSGLWWFFTAVTAGFGLLSKQMMLVFLALVPLYLAVNRERRHLLRSWWPWLMIGLALIALLPPLWWNMEHGWITFRHTAHHFEAGGGGPFHFLRTLLEFIGGQFLLLSPVTWSLLALLTIVLLSNFGRQDRRVRFLLLFGGFCLLFFLLLSLRQRINANWPAVFYPAALLLLAAWGNGEISAGGRLDTWRRLFVPGVMVGVVFALLAYLLPFLLPYSSLGGSHSDPTSEVKGWQQLAAEVESVREELAQGEKIFLVAGQRQDVSELAFYLPDRPRIYKWANAKGEISSQYDLWPQPTDKVGQDALIVMRQEIGLPGDLAGSFSSITKIREFDVLLGPGGKRGYVLYLGRGLRRWPR